MRITLLCEDRMHEQFLAGLCKERGYRIVRRDVAPSGEGAGSDWVIQRFARHVRGRGPARSSQPRADVMNRSLPSACLGIYSAASRLLDTCLPPRTA